MAITKGSNKANTATMPTGASVPRCREIAYFLLEQRENVVTAHDGVPREGGFAMRCR